MRWFLLLLIVLNLFFYLWNQQQAPARAGEAVPSGGHGAQQQRITLLSESAAPSSRAPHLNPMIQDICLFLGGFDQEAPAKAVEQRLLSLDIQSNIEPITAPAGLDYWVYLSPLASRAASLRQLKELQSRGIDSYIITVGDLNKGISLGIFARRDSAESVINRLREGGYDPLMRELPRTHRRYWVRVAAQSRGQVDDGLLNGLAREIQGLQY